MSIAQQRSYAQRHVYDNWAYYQVAQAKTEVDVFIWKKADSAEWKLVIAC